MTDLELLRHAKDYIDQLANGIDPISGNEMPGDTVLNQVRLTRCFFYVSDILRQVIENGGQVRARVKKEPFSLTPEQRAKIPIYIRPQPVSRFLEGLNGQIDLRTTRKLPVRAITGWLVDMGYLEVQMDAEGRHVKSPTEEGMQIGLSLGPRHGPNGDYFVVLYDEEAQRFIVDNLDAIIARHYESLPGEEVAEGEANGGSGEVKDEAE